MTLSPAQLETYQSRGVLVVEDVVPPQTLAAVRNEYEALLDGLLADWGVGAQYAGKSFAEKIKGTYADGFDWFQPMDISLPGDRITADTPMHFGPAVFDLLRSPGILDVVEALIGPEITSCPIQHVRIKPPERQLHADETRAHVGGTAWHQDRGVTHAEADDTDMVTVWVAITDATLDNGCLQAIPWKAPELLTHCPQVQTAIPAGALDLDRAEALPVRAGGVVLFHPMVPHASRPNLSGDIRWSFDLRYSRTGQPTGRSHFPQIVLRSGSAPERVETDWRHWKTLWEDARARLAQGPHIEQHRWDADAPVCA
ncbi:MAG: phytanoyl-CoA dioxygenase family protein [Pseudomonadota bacterium]